MQRGLAPQAPHLSLFFQGCHPPCLTSARPSAGKSISPIAPGRCPTAMTWTSLWLAEPRRASDGVTQAPLGTPRHCPHQSLPGFLPFLHC